MNQKLPTLNPYDVLNVSPKASNKEIAVAFKMAIKARKYPIDIIAKAHKSLMNPQERIIADYLRPITKIVKRFKKSDLSALHKSTEKLVFLSEFDNLEQAISDIDRVSQSDKQLGELLFKDSPTNYNF